MLTVCKKLFEELNKNSIEYLSFKSIEQNKNDLNGERGDLDILLKKSDFSKADELLTQLNFRKAILPPSSDGICFYLGYDNETQKYITLHLHPELRFGSKKYKEFRWSIEDEIFKRKIFDAELGINTISKEDEFCLLFLRMTLKRNPKKNDLKRLSYLSNNIQEKDIILKEIIQKIIGKPINVLLGIDYTSGVIVEMQKEYKPKVLKHFRRAEGNNINIAKRIITGEYVFLISSITRLLGFPSYRIRRKGLLIALQGIDGCGKSTQVKILSNLKYLQTTGLKMTYGGSNQYWIPFLKKSLIFFSEKKGILVKIIKAFLSSLSVLDRRMRLLPAIINVWKGKIVIFDRYFYDDLSSIQKMNTSKKKISTIKRISKKILLGQLGRVPDMTFFLDIDAEDSYKRKQDYPFEEVKEQIEAYREVFKDRKEVIYIDATMSIEDVNHKIMEYINNY